MQTWAKRLLTKLFLCGGLFACQEPLPDQTEKNATEARDIQADVSTEAPSPFLMAVKLANVPKEQLDQKFAAMGVKARTGVDIYRLYYRTTDLKNNPVKATGLIIVPMIRLPVFPWISLQHVTITGEAQAPSNKPEEGVFEASQGFITVVADQIGYGGTAGTMHPYLFKNAYPKALIEMLRASKTFFEANGLTVGPLFLRGYSEGAYATMALQKAIETQFSSEFQLVASAAGAGPFELEQTARQALTLPQVNPVNLSLLALSYGQYLAPEIDLSRIFAIDLNDVKTTLNGSKTYDQALQILPSAPSTLFRAEFIADFVLDQPATPEAQTLRRLLGENAHFKDGWIPKTQTRFYHCRDDESVPVQATDYAVATIQALAPNAPVAKVILDSPDPNQPYRHGTCPLYYTPVSWFAEIMATQPM
jgi:pimeloyl-ACP methyl ester carboxylesterase